MKLKDICIEITDGSHNPPQGGEISDYYMISSKNIFDDRITMDEPRYLSEEQFLSENKRTNIVPGDVLMTIVGTVGRAAVVNKDIGKITLQRSVAVLHPKKDICDSRYLMYALQSKRAYFEKEAHGVAQKGLYLKQLSDIDIVVPAIDKQVIIVDLLDRVNGIIKYRQKQIEALDNLIKARFVELFGDSIINPKGWKRCKFGDVVFYQEGPGVRNWQFRDSGVKLINIRNVINDSLDLSNTNNYLEIDEVETKYKHFLLNEGDYVMASSGVTWGKIAEVYKEHLPLCLNTSMIRIRPIDSNVICKKYLFHFIKSDGFRKQIERLITGSAQPNFGPSHLAKIDILVPDIELQQKFSLFTEQVDKSKVAIQKSLEKTRLLFDSLMQKYFG